MLSAESEPQLELKMKLNFLSSLEEKPNQNENDKL
jgi:hypothetical protein